MEKLERDYDSEIRDLKAQVYDLMAVSEQAQIFIYENAKKASAINEQIMKLEQEKKEPKTPTP